MANKRQKHIMLRPRSLAVLHHSRLMPLPTALFQECWLLQGTLRPLGGRRPGTQTTGRKRRRKTTMCLQGQLESRSSGGDAGPEPHRAAQEVLERVQSTGVNLGPKSRPRCSVQTSADPGRLDVLHRPIGVMSEGSVSLAHSQRTYTALGRSDVLMHRKKKVTTTDLIHRKPFVYTGVARCQGGIAPVPSPFLRVGHIKHTLTLEDLATLEDENWVNDQVINMYGELIMEDIQHKVHFFNSFFYQQLMSRGYEGVKRWTRKVDLFSKRLLLVPVHLEVHWSLIAVDLSNLKLCYYDSQGTVFRHAMENVLRYIRSEAKERGRSDFLSGWKMVLNKRIPLQTNSNDCGVFLLEYCRCLAHERPLLFSQKDMHKIRKRICKELCAGRLLESC